MEHIKHFAVYIICIVFCTVVVSCGNKTSVQGMDTGNVFDSYYKVQDALFKSDAALTKSEAQKLQKALIEIKVTDESKKSEWITLLDKAGSPALKISESSDLNIQRKDFEDLSKAMEEMARKFSPGKKVYKVFCPMAFNNKGANWLSDKDEVKNPYFGAEMPDCGVVKETIE